MIKSNAWRNTSREKKVRVEIQTASSANSGPSLLAPSLGRVTRPLSADTTVPAASHTTTPNRQHCAPLLPSPRKPFISASNTAYKRHTSQHRHPRSPSGEQHRGDQSTTTVSILSNAHLRTVRATSWLSQLPVTLSG